MNQKTESKIPKYKLKDSKQKRLVLTSLLFVHVPLFIYFFPFIFTRMFYHSHGLFLLITPLWTTLFSLHIFHTFAAFKKYIKAKEQFFTHLSIYLPGLFYGFIYGLIFFLIEPSIFFAIFALIFLWSYFLYLHFKNYKSEALNMEEKSQYDDLESDWDENDSTNQPKDRSFVYKEEDKEIEGFSEESLRKIAEEKVKYRDSVMIHFFTYILINILLFVLFLNLKIPQISFLIIFAWLIGLSLHTVSYILYARGTFPMAKRGVIYHIVTYITGSIFLGVLRSILILIGPYQEFVFVSTVNSIMTTIFLLWGLAVLVHLAIYKLFFSVKIEKNGEIKTRREMQIEKEIQKMKRKLMRE